MVCSHKMAKKEKRSDRKCNEIQRPEYIIEVQKVEIRMYRKVIGVLNNGAAVALLLGKSMKKTLNDNVERRRIIAGKVEIADDDRPNKEVTCKDEDR